MSYGELSNTQETMVMPLLQMKNIRGKPYITVSAKGMINGLSNIPNDGADFGPDTTLNATSPRQYGAPYTKTSGIQEAQNYLSKGGHIVLGNGDFYIYDTITISNNNIIISGAGFQEYTSGSLAAESGTRIVLGNNVNKTMISITGYKYLFENFEINGNSPNNTTTGLYGIYAAASDLGMDLHLRTMYVMQVNGIGVYSNSGFYTETLITEGNASWGLYLDGQGGWLVSGYLSYADGGGAYLGCNYTNISNILISGSGTAGLPLLKITGGNNTISNVTLDSTMPGVTTYPALILVTGRSNQIRGINIAESPATTCISITSGGFNQFIGIYLDSGNPTYFVEDTSDGSNTFSSIYLLTSSSLTFSKISTSLFQDNISDVHAYSNVSGEAIDVLSPVFGTNPPGSGINYQNNNSYTIRLKIPVTYSPTSTAAATLATGISVDSTVTTSTKVSIPAGATTGEILTYEMDVPAGWFFELVVTNATIGTVEVQAVP